nr:hypothetical protein [Tanacetum cinerariifolium]
NWKYQQADYALKPVKPSIDGEPSYEGIPQGLHDITQPRWTDADVRRYGYWSVFAGAFGYTYGQNSVMQMHSSFDKGSAYGSSELWSSAIHAPGSAQMQYLKDLMLSRPGYFERVPDQSLIAGDAGQKYNRLLATRGKNYAFIYTYNGREMKVNLGKIAGAKVKASWYSPRDGKTTAIGTFANKGTREFNPPGEQKDGNDWVLVLDGKPIDSKLRGGAGLVRGVERRLLVHVVSRAGYRWAAPALQLQRVQVAGFGPHVFEAAGGAGQADARPQHHAGAGWHVPLGLDVRLEGRQGFWLRQL